MKLTDEDTKCLDGVRGEAAGLAMEILIRVGKAFGAEQMIPVSSAHILGHYGSLHDAGIEFLEKLVKAGGRCSVPTTVDPSSVDFDRWEQFKVPTDYVAKQRSIEKAVTDLGVIPSWSCTPYHCLNVPRFGEAVAWAESSAVAYANSVIGARTNRTPFGLDICAAITGRIPEFGYYLPENRRGSILFELEETDLSDLDYHTLGAFVGARAGARVPVIRGIPTSVTNDRLKCLGAGAASAGSVALFHAVGITPEARAGDPLGGEDPEEVFHVGRGELDAVAEAISTAQDSSAVEMVTLGCPLLSVEELKTIYGLMASRRVKNDLLLWIYLTRESYELGRKMGLIDSMEQAGVWFSTGTCATISPVKVWGFSTVMTNSAKCALVVPSEHDVRILYRDTETCILTATEPT